MENGIILKRKAEQDFIEKTEFSFFSFNTIFDDGIYKLTLEQIERENEDNKLSNEDIELQLSTQTNNDIIDFNPNDWIIYDDYDVVEFNLKLEEYYTYFENEIVDNLLLLNSENRLHYLFRLKRTLEEHISIPRKFTNPDFNFEVRDYENHILLDTKYMRKSNIAKYELISSAIEFIDFQIDIVNETKKDFPKIDYESAAQKIAWLHELGVIDVILNRTKRNDTNNWSAAAKVIKSFTDLELDVVRQCITAIYQPNNTNKKNNPLNTAKNKLFIENMKTMFNID